MLNCGKDGRLMTKDEILEEGHKLIGKTFKDIKNEKIPSGNKGGVGQHVEKHYFNIPTNSLNEPDFVKAGIDLKVTPMKLLKNNTYSSKERLVITIIDYEAEGDKKFETSSFYKKAYMMYILFYEYINQRPKLDLKIIKDYLYELKNHTKDLIQIRRDWELIHELIASGRAEEISGGLTYYLEALNKGQGHGKNLRKQYNSDKKAPQRAYAFKSRYINQLFYNQENESLFTIEEISKHSFDEAINYKLSKFIGKTISEIETLVNYKSDSKNYIATLIPRMLNLNSDLEKTDEFLKSSIVPKTIRVEEDSSIKEHMSLPYFKYKDIIKENWNNSKIRKYLSENKFMFAVFKNNGTDYVFKGIKMWNMPITILDNDYKTVWKKTIDVINNGTIVNKISGKRRFTFFPKPSESKVGHVRPHGQNTEDTFPLPTPDKLTNVSSYTKHSFWLNNSYILDIIEDLIK